MVVLVTGGAGFIGSHLVDKLIENQERVIVIDKQDPEFRNEKAEYVKKNIVTDEINEYFKEIETVFHLAADPLVNKSVKEPEESFNENAVGTFKILEYCRKNKVKQIVFTSTSAVYGDAEKIPTPENYYCRPISNYASSKICGEAYISSYSHSYGIKGTIVRLANIFGQRGKHGVIFDFFHKLKKDPNKLEILGNGEQEKSYLHVKDCVDGIITAWKKQEKNIDYFNIGSNEKTKVKQIAEKICKKMNLNPEFAFTGGKRGWIGDVSLMLLDCSKLKKIGWENKISFTKGLEQFIEYLEE